MNDFEIPFNCHSITCQGHSTTCMWVVQKRYHFLVSPIFDIDVFLATVHTRIDELSVHQYFDNIKCRDSQHSQQMGATTTYKKVVLTRIPLHYFKIRNCCLCCSTIKLFSQNHTTSFTSSTVVCL